MLICTLYYITVLTFAYLVYTFVVSSSWCVEHVCSVLMVLYLQLFCITGSVNYTSEDTEFS